MSQLCYDRSGEVVDVIADAERDRDTTSGFMIYINAEVAPVRVVKSTPEEQHADQDEGRGNRIPDKVHPMDALTATKSGVFVIDIKTIPALLHITNQPRQKFNLALSA